MTDPGLAAAARAASLAAQAAVREVARAARTVRHAANAGWVVTADVQRAVIDAESAARTAARAARTTEMITARAPSRVALDVAKAEQRLEDEAWATVWDTRHKRGGDDGAVKAARAQTVRAANAWDAWARAWDGRFDTDDMDDADRRGTMTLRGKTNNKRRNQ